MNYKKISKVSLFAVIALIIAVPSVSLAVGGAGEQTKGDAPSENFQETKANLQEKRTEQTCTALVNRAEQIQNRLNERISQLTQKRVSIESNIQARVEKRIAQRTGKQVRRGRSG